MFGGEQESNDEEMEGDGFLMISRKGIIEW